MKTLLIATALMLATTAHAARDWVHIGDGEKGKFYLDAEDVRRNRAAPGENYYGVKQVLNRKVIRVEDVVTYDTIFNMVGFNCNTRQWTILNEQLLNDGVEVAMKRSDGQPVWDNIGPGFSEQLWTLICKP